MQPSIATIVSPMFERYAPHASLDVTPSFSSAARTRDASSASSANVQRLSSRDSETETSASAFASAAPGAPWRSMFSAKLSCTPGK